MPRNAYVNLRYGFSATALGTLLLASPLANAQDAGVSYGTYGTPSLIDMPTAFADEDATIATTFSKVGDTTRTTLTFQIAPRLSGSFRYTALGNFNHPHSVDGTYYDRSFDLRYQLLDEGDIRPAVAIGFQDFIGTGLYGGEYIVASKTLKPGLQVTGGLGWGRLAGHGSFASFGNRSTTILATGGIPAYDRWFRGDISAFGGIAFQPSDKLTFKIEYSSDAYSEETANGGFDRSSSLNYGIDYRLNRGTQLSLYHTYGSTFGAQLTFLANPRHSAAPGGSEGAPLPVAVRAPGQASDLGWAVDPSAKAKTEKRLRSTLKLEGISLGALDLTEDSAIVRIHNSRYGVGAQAIGRTARAMTRSLPGSVENFIIVPIVDGIPMSAVELKRSDIERFEHSDSALMLERAVVSDAFGLAKGTMDPTRKRFEWSFRPILNFSMFDPQNPVRADLRARAEASYTIAPNIVLAGSISKTLVGSIGDGQIKNSTNLPPVRTNSALYAKQGDPSLDYLTLSHYARPAENIYSRLTLGYLESMYAGVSGEVLWKPVDSRLALGAELNYVQQRDFDQQLGLRDYDILMGHASAYYDIGKGYHGQLDVGRYLAGDIGATISVDREFANGWRLGAYATFTDASADDFGEGSFDKGLRFTIPLSWATSKPSRFDAKVNLQSLTRDGGARLNVRGRLYEKTREYHKPELAESWGKFWR